MLRPGPAAETGRRPGVASGLALALLCAAYAGVLAVGLLTLPTPAHPIQPPWLPLMEVLILAIAPTMVLWAVALHAVVPPADRPWALAAIAFMAMSAAVTCVVHWSILALAGQPAFAAAPWARLVFAFEWPSVVYALDILAWDGLFPLAALCAALALRGAAAPAGVRRLLLASAALSFAGLAGVPLADMRVRNIGIVGYVLLFPAATAWLALHLRGQASGAVGKGDGGRDNDRA